jgi:hypothetical protein
MLIKLSLRGNRTRAAARQSPHFHRKFPEGHSIFLSRNSTAIKNAETCEAWTEKKNTENSREESWFLLFSIVSKKQWSSLRRFARKCESMWKQWIWIYGLHAGSLFRTRTCFYVVVRGAYAVCFYGLYSLSDCEFVIVFLWIILLTFCFFYNGSPVLGLQLAIVVCNGCLRVCLWLFFNMFLMSKCIKIIFFIFFKKYFLYQRIKTIQNIKKLILSKKNWIF